MMNNPYSLDSIETLEKILTEIEDFCKSNSKEGKSLKVNGDDDMLKKTY